MNPQKKIIYILGGLVGVFVITTIVLAAILGTRGKSNDKNDNTNNIGKEICTTKSCIYAANMILENIDETVDPCEDFGEFACGTFLKTQRIPEDLPSYDMFDMLDNKLIYSAAGLLEESENKDDIPSTINAKKLYKSCLNETSAELKGEAQLKETINNVFKGWPILDNNSWNKDAPLLDVLVTSRLYDLKQIVDVYINIDPKNPKKSVLKLRQPSWLLNKAFYDESKVKPQIDAYKQFIFQMAKYLGSKETDEEIKSQVENMFKLEKALADHTLEEDQRRNTTYVNMTIKELSGRIPYFPWKEYIVDGIFKNVENVTIDENEIILIDDMDYITNATKIYNDYATNKKKDLKNLLLWVFIKDTTYALPKKYRDANQEYDKFLKGTTSAKPRSYTCSTYVLQKFQYPTGRLYVSKYFNNQSKTAATEMIHYITESFKSIIRKSDWMDEESKEKAIAKADNIDSKIGYPDFIFDEKEMHNRYKDFVFREDDYLGNTLTLAKVTVANDLKAFREEKDRKIWTLGPAFVNAMYSPNFNHILFPAGILQAPFYDLQYPNYLNYGGIGSVIGHEITHGFDDKGRRYNKDGIFIPDGEAGLWSEKTIENYKEKAKCIIDQYSNYLVKQVNMTLNGFQTQGENIADNGGIKESFYAYQNWISKQKKEEPLLPGLNYTQSQLFFINYAQVWCGKYRDQLMIQTILTDEHSPNPIRIIGPTSNFVEFSKAFNCKANTSNNPDKKCSVW